MTHQAVLSPPITGEPLETFSLESGLLTRTLTTRLGELRKSSIPLETDNRQSTADLAAEYDLAWLKAKQQPTLRGPGDRNVRVVDLFAGCGGLSLGVMEACRALELNMSPVFAVDTDVRALQVYAENFKGGEVTDEPVEQLLDGSIGSEPTSREKRLGNRIGPVDLLIGGPPCQGHSDLNNHTRRDDPRNALYLRMARFCEVLRPTHVLIENVPGVLRDKSHVAQTTWRILRELGYSVSTGTVNSVDVGVPQSRRRNLTVASLRTEPDIESLIKNYRTGQRPAEWAFDDLIERYSSESIFDSAPIPAGKTRQRIEYLFANNLFDLPDSERPACHRLKPHTYKSNYGRMRPDRPAQTITTGFGVMGKGRFVHPRRPRTLTPHEAARLQFFPDFFTFGSHGRIQLQKLIGNAVPPKLGFVLGVHLLR